jgi:hypothetical protein
MNGSVLWLTPLCPAGHLLRELAGKMSARVWLPLLPHGEKYRAQRGDEGAATTWEPPSSNPSGHLLPAGEKREPGHQASGG